MFTLHNCDCLTFQPPAFDVVITDPPFPNNSDIFAEMIADWHAEYLYLEASKKPMIIFWDTLTQPCDKIPNSRHVFHKSNGYNAGKWESINVYLGDNIRRESLVLSYPTIAGTNWERAIMESHPTTKPLKLMRWLVEKYTEPNQIVFDPFMGIGSTGVACVELGRHFIGCEKSAEYFPIAEKRIREAVFVPNFYTPSNNRLQPTAFGVGTQAQFPLLGGTQAEESSATHGGG